MAQTSSKRGGRSAPGSARRTRAMLVVVVGLVGLLATACAQPASSAPTVADAPQSFSGTGVHKTPPFTLKAGNYRVRWTATQSGGESCYHGGSLQPVAGGGSLIIANQFGVTGTQSEDVDLPGVPGGQYYLSMSSQCAWKVTITPR